MRSLFANRDADGVEAWPVADPVRRFRRVRRWCGGGDVAAFGRTFRRVVHRPSGHHAPRVRRPLNQISLAWVGIWVFSGLAGAAHADLYTGHVASLEWKTHSADEIIRVKVREGLDGEFQTETLETFIRGDITEQEAAKIADAWQPPAMGFGQANEKPVGEWLLFVRRFDDGSEAVDHVVYLRNPTLASGTSAIRADGTILEDPKQILGAIQERLLRRKPMTNRERNARRFVDRGDDRVLFNGNAEAPQRVVAWLGGFQIPADIHQWDTPPDDRSRDEDLWVRNLTVPADAAYREVLLRHWDDVVANAPPSARDTAKYPLAALANYPGRETEAVLTAIAADRSWFSPAAKPTLHYLRFYDPEFSADDRRLVGSWIARDSRRTIQYDLMEDHALMMRCEFRPSSTNRSPNWIARGRWNLHHGTLRWLCLGVREPTSAGFRNQGPPGPFFDEREVESVREDIIRFSDQTRLTRTQDPIVMAP